MPNLIELFLKNYIEFKLDEIKEELKIPNIDESYNLHLAFNNYLKIHFQMS